MMNKQLIKWLPAIIPLLLWNCESSQIEQEDVSDIPAEISFEANVIPIFESSCIDCHDGSVPPNLTQPGAYLNLIAGGYISKENADNSYFYQKIDIGGSMAQHVTEKERLIIHNWIEQGAANN